MNVSTLIEGYTFYPQPIFDARGQIVSAELLGRRTLERQAPFGQILKLAKQTDTTSRIFAHAVDYAVHLLSQIRYSGCGVSINICPLSLIKPGLVERLEWELNNAHLPPELLTLEITETIPFGDLDALARIVADIKDIGCRIYLDDFITGFSKLRHVVDLKVDGIKIDRTHIMSAASKGQSMLSLLASLAERQNLKAVAEGIETPAELLKVNQLNIPFRQGYLLARPMPIDAFIGLLQSQVLQAA